jgi:hypothetical protein
MPLICHIIDMDMCVNNTHGTRCCCFATATRFFAGLPRCYVVSTLLVWFLRSVICLCFCLSVRYCASLVVYRSRGLAVAASITLSRCGNCNHALPWRPSTSLIYICLSCRTGSCSGRTIPSDAIATFAGSPQYIGSPATCAYRTIEHILGVSKETSFFFFLCRLYNCKRCM